MVDFGAALSGAADTLRRIGDFGARQLSEFIQAGANLESSVNAFSALYGSVEAAENAISLLRRAAQDPGLTFPVADRAARRFATLNIEIEDSVGIIRGFANAAALGGTSADQLDEGLRQVFQTIARGKIEQEDLNSITERFGTISRVVRAEYGANAEEINKSLKESNTSILEFIQNISSLRGVARADTDTLANSFSNLANAVTLARQEIGKELTPIVKPLVNALTDLVNQVQTLPGPLKLLAGLFTGATAVFGRFGSAALEVVSAVSLITIAFGGIGPLIGRITVFVANIVKSLVLLGRRLIGISYLFTTTAAGTTVVYTAFQTLNGILNSLVGAITKFGSAAASIVSGLTAIYSGVRLILVLGKGIADARREAEEAEKSLRSLTKTQTGLSISTKEANQAYVETNKVFGETREIVMSGLERVPSIMKEVGLTTRDANGLIVNFNNSLEDKGKLQTLREIRDLFESLPEPVKVTAELIERMQIALREIRDQRILAGTGPGPRPVRFSRRDLIQGLRPSGTIQTGRQTAPPSLVDFTDQTRVSDEVKEKVIENLEDEVDAAKKNQEELFRIRVQYAQRYQELVDPVRFARERREFFNRIRAEGEQYRNEIDRAEEAQLREERRRAQERIRIAEDQFRAITNFRRSQNQFNQQLAELQIARDNLVYENLLNNVEQVNNTVIGLQSSFSQAARAGVVGAQTMANAFIAATLAIEGTKTAIEGVRNAAQGLASGDVLGSILGILQAVGGIVGVIVGFINLFRSFGQSPSTSTGSTRGNNVSRHLQGGRSNTAAAVTAVQQTAVRGPDASSAGNFGVQANRDIAGELAGEVIESPVILNLTIGDQTIQELTKETIRLQKRGRAIR